MASSGDATGATDEVITGAGERPGEGHLRRLAQHVFIYGLGRFGLQLFSLITLPILTRILTPADYGVIDSIVAITAVAAIVSSLALESGAQRSYFDYPEEEVRARRIVLSTAFWAIVAWSATLTLTLVAMSSWLSTVVYGSDEYRTLLALAFAAMPIAVAANYFQEILRLRQQPIRYVVIVLVAATASVAAVLILVAALERGLKGYYVAGLIGGIPALVLGYTFVHGALGRLFDRRELRTMLVYSLPLVPVAGATWVMQLADRLFLLHYSTLDELGRYALAVRLSNVLLFAVVAFGVAWAPFILDLHSRDAHAERQIRGRALTYVAFVLCLGAVAISIFAREIFLVLTTKAFADAYRVVGLLAFGIVAGGFCAVTMSGISLARRTRYFARYALYVAALNTILNFALIPPYGIVGAAVSTLATSVALAVLYYYRSQRLDPVPFEVRRLFVTVGLAAGITTVGSLIALEPLWLSVVVKLPLLLLFPVLVVLFGGIDSTTVRYVLKPSLILRRPPES